MKTNQEILDRLDTELTEELIDRAVAYCGMKVTRRPWYGILGVDAMAKGHKPEDIVQNVILKTIQGAVDGPGKKGRRIWDGHRDLYDYLTSQIDSEISNLGTSWVNQNFQVVGQLERSSEEGHRESFYESVTDETAKDPQEIALSAEAERASDQFVSDLLDALGDDDLLTAIIGEILDGARKPREIAAELDVPVEEIYKARKRLQRRVDDFHASRNEEVKDG